MSRKAVFKSMKSPAEISRDAVGVIKKNVPKGTNLDEFYVTEGKGRMTAVGKSTSGILHNSQVWVEARREKDATLIEVHANDDKSDGLVDKLKKQL